MAISRGDHGLDVVAGEELDVVDREDVRRVAHRDDERGAGAVDRDDVVLLADLLRDELDDLRVDLEVVEVDRRDAVLLGEEVGELRLLDGADLDEVVADAAAGLGLLVLGLLELRHRDEVLADQQLAKSTTHLHLETFGSSEARKNSTRRSGVGQGARPRRIAAKTLWRCPLAHLRGG